jgi:hypothetical protein
MSLLSHVRRRMPEGAAQAPQDPCPHWELAPRWDSVADMGRADRVTHYVCTKCGERISRREAAARAS